jgi:hypothetical protein
MTKKNIQFGLAAALIIGAILAGGRHGLQTKNATMRVPLPEAVRSKDLSLGPCSPAEVWVAAVDYLDSRVVGELGLERALANRDVTLTHLVVGAGEVRTVSLGRGNLLSLVRTADGALQGLMSNSIGSSEGHEWLLVSEDQGEHWIKAPAPKGLIGLVAANGRGLYGWTRNAVGFASTASDAWRFLEVSPYRLYPSTASVVSTRDEAGNLWLPLTLEEGASGPLARLLVVTPTLEPTLVHKWATEVVEGVAPVGDGSALVALSGAKPAALRIARVGRGMAESTVWRAAKASGRLSGRGSLAANLWGRFGRPASMLEAPEQRLVFSRDGFRSWKEIDLTGDRPRSTCLTEQGMWLVPDGKGELRYLDLR